MDAEEAAAINSMTAEIFKDLILPEIEKEINEGRTFASLRQMFNSLILSAWYKQNLKETVIGQVYAERNKISGIELEQGSVTKKIYDQYMAAIEQGVFDYIKEEYDPNTDEVMPRQYFSGGIEADIKTLTRAQSIDDFGDAENAAIGRMRDAFHVKATFAAEGHDHRDLFLQLWHETGVGYVEVEEITDDAAKEGTGDEHVLFDLDFLDVVQNEDMDYTGAYYILMTYQGLLTRGLSAPSAAARKALGLNENERWDSPGIFIGNVKDEKILQKLGIESFEHGSDRGVHALTRNKIFHGMAAFSGLPHYMVMALEMVRDEYIAHKKKALDGEEPTIKDLIASVTSNYNQAMIDLEKKVDDAEAKAVIEEARQQGLAAMFKNALQLAEKNLSSYGNGTRDPLLLTKMKLNDEDRDYSDVEGTPTVEDLRKMFGANDQVWELGAVQMGAIGDAFGRDLMLGLSGTPTTLATIPSLMSGDTTKVKPGRRLAINWGGTNVSLGVYDVAEDGTPTLVGEIIDRDWDDEHRTGAKDPLAFIAGLAQELEITDIEGVGFIFSFDSYKTNNVIDSRVGKTAPGTKGWTYLEDYLDKEIVPPVQQALADAGITATINVEQNDTVMALLAGLAQFGVVLGTGFNIAYYDAVTDQIYNLEAGEFISRTMPFTKYDLVLLQEYLPLGRKATEKMITGDYMVEHARLMILDKVPNQSIQNLLADQWSLDYELFDEIDAIMHPNQIGQKVREFFRRDYQMDVSFQEAREIYNAIHSTAVRTGDVVAGIFRGAAKFAAVREGDIDFNKLRTFVVDGSVYNRTPNIPRYIREALKRMDGEIGPKSDKIQIQGLERDLGLDVLAGAAVASSVVAARPTDHAPDFVEKPGIDRDAADFAGPGGRYLKTPASRLEGQEKSSEEVVGGIDFNSGLLNMELRRDENGIPIPMPQNPIYNMEFNGLVPIIINVAPVTNLPLLLGIKEEEIEEIRQYSYAS